MTGPFATTQDFNLKKMGSRMLRAARLDGETFRELRDDPAVTAQSILVVAIIGLCYGAGFGFFLAGTSILDVLTITLIGLFSAPENNRLLGHIPPIFLLVGSRTSLHFDVHSNNNSL